MPFASPLALLGLLFVPAVIAMYMLKLRRDEAMVPSTQLWTRLLTDVEANAPWQRLRRSLLLLLQLLLVLILVLLAARRRASYVDLSSDTNLAELMFAELRRRRVLG